MRLRVRLLSHGLTRSFSAPSSVTEVSRGVAYLARAPQRLLAGRFDHSFDDQVPLTDRAAATGGNCALAVTFAILSVSAASAAAAVLKHTIKAPKNIEG
jgi:hypothetical protein